MQVPFGNLYDQYLSIKEDIDDAIEGVIRDSAFIRGRRVEEFEDNYAKEMNVERCISCANGTDALYISMIALGIKPGDEVIVPAMSWISTSETVSQAGGKIVFCDIRDDSYTLDESKIENLITDRTVGIIPVHLYGHPANMKEIGAIAKKHGLWVIEDCAQAHLATCDGGLAGTFGDMATFSFYPGKNLGAMGDAGAIVTNNAALADKAAMFARHGGLKKHDHEIEGINSRLDGLQAAILSAKLPHLKDWTERRREIAAVYDDALGQIADIKAPVTLGNVLHSYHLYVVNSNGISSMKWIRLKAGRIKCHLRINWNE